MKQEDSSISFDKTLTVGMPVGLAVGVTVGSVG